MSETSLPSRPEHALVQSHGQKLACRGRYRPTSVLTFLEKFSQTGSHILINCSDQAERIVVDVNFGAFEEAVA
jgi:DNA polymerase IIIc chi subunit